MEKKYKVFLGNESVGIAEVKRCGLYYHINCRCCISGDVPYKVIITGDNKEVDLGLCVPKEGGFGMEVRIPVKQIGEGALSFRAIPRHRFNNAEFVPICSEEPFRYLYRLGNAYLAKRNGQMGVEIR